MTGIMWSAINLFLLGYPDQASTQGREAANMAEEITHPFTLASANFYAGLLFVALRATDAGHAMRKWLSM